MTHNVGQVGGITPYSSRGFTGPGGTRYIRISPIVSSTNPSRFIPGIGVVHGDPDELAQLLKKSPGVNVQYGGNIGGVVKHRPKGFTSEGQFTFPSDATITDEEQGYLDQQIEISNERKNATLQGRALNPLGAGGNYSVFQERKQEINDRAAGFRQQAADSRDRAAGFGQPEQPRDPIRDRRAQILEDLLYASNAGSGFRDQARQFKDSLPFNNFGYEALGLDDSDFFRALGIQDPDSVRRGANIGRVQERADYSTIGAIQPKGPSFLQSRLRSYQPVGRIDPTNRSFYEYVIANPRQFPTQRQNSGYFTQTPPAGRGKFVGNAGGESRTKPLYYVKRIPKDDYRTSGFTYENPAQTQLDYGYNNPSYADALSQLLIGAPNIGNQTAQFGKGILQSLARRGLEPDVGTRYATGRAGKRRSAYDEIFGAEGSIAGLRGGQGVSRGTEFSNFGATEALVNPVNRQINEFINEYGTGNIFETIGSLKMTPEQIKDLQKRKLEAGILLGQDTPQGLSTVFGDEDKQFGGQVNEGVF